MWFTEHHGTTAARAGGFLAAANVVNVRLHATNDDFMLKATSFY